jgi:hypothetical protein
MGLAALVAELALELTNRTSADANSGPTALNGS